MLIILLCCRHRNSSHSVGLWHRKFLTLSEFFPWLSVVDRLIKKNRAPNTSNYLINHCKPSFLVITHYVIYLYGFITHSILFDFHI